MIPLTEWAEGVPCGRLEDYQAVRRALLELPLDERSAIVARRRTAINRQGNERRGLWITLVKMASGCVDCGYREHPAALHFDHVDPATKRWGIAGSWGRRLTDLCEEMARCEVRCANCHAIRTHPRSCRWDGLT